ncbi:MAG: hypothetical protein HYZ77_09145, partial [Serratia liquefaciens]|nr:hypothetical protein [Serratia liquefaciens]
YDPASNQIATSSAKLPSSENARKGDTLRAAAGPTRAGLLYGMTQVGRLFSFESETETVKDLGPNFGDGAYTAVMVLSPDSDFFRYMKSPDSTRK